jgi:hypothetical protein
MVEHFKRLIESAQTRPGAPSREAETGKAGLKKGDGLQLAPHSDWVDVAGAN